MFIYIYIYPCICIQAWWESFYMYFAKTSQGMHLDIARDMLAVFTTRIRICSSACRGRRAIRFFLFFNAYQSKPLLELVHKRPYRARWGNGTFLLAFLWA